MKSLPGQLSSLHDCVWLYSPVQSMPSNIASWLIDLFLPCSPPPQVTEHVSHALHWPQTQFTGDVGCKIKFHYPCIMQESLYQDSRCYCMIETPFYSLCTHCQQERIVEWFLCFSLECRYHMLQSSLPIHPIVPMNNYLKCGVYMIVCEMFLFVFDRSPFPFITT